MITSFLKMALRYARRNQFHTSLNVLGLSLGLTSTFFVLIFLHHEYSYDTSHRKSDQIYRVTAERNTGWFPHLPKEHAEKLQANSLPGVEDMVLFRRMPSMLFQTKKTKFFEQKGLITQPGSSFFTFFDHDFIAGESTSALKKANSIVITEKIAKKYFGDRPALGEHILLDTIELTITGVIRDLPSNTHFNFDFVLSYQPAIDIGSSLFTYLLASPTAEISDIEKKVLMAYQSGNEHQKLEAVKIQRLTEIHFAPAGTYEMKPPANPIYIKAFIIFGILVLLITIASHVNLSVAIYSKRQREIALRKIMGSSNRHIASQFLLEAITFSLVCLPIALSLCYFSIPFFNEWMGLRVESEILFAGWMLSAGTFITFFVGLVSGMYPALIIPRLKSTLLLKSPDIVGRDGFSFRKILLTGQFVGLVLFGTMSFLVYKQVSLLHNRDLGFDKNWVVKIGGAYSVDTTEFRAIKQKLLQHTGIEFISAGLVPGDEDYGLPYRSENSEVIYRDAIRLSTDYDYFDVLRIPIVESAFPKGNCPKRMFLINQTMAKRLGYSNPIGQKIVMWPGSPNERVEEIQGVFGDYNFYSLHQAVAPQTIIARDNQRAIDTNILVRMSGVNVEETIQAIRNVVAEICPDTPNDVEFLDEDLAAFYENERRLLQASSILLTLSLVFAAIGLLGLVSYMITRRAKEIAVRRVLGASSSNIFRLMNKEYVRIAAYATILGSILSWIASQYWLQNFAYSIDISPWVFIAAFALIMLFELLLTGYFSLRATRINVADTLKEE